MAIPLDKLGVSSAPRRVTIDADEARAYAAATNDDNPAYTSAKFAPPLFAVVPTWETLMETVLQLAPPEMLMMVVHGEQDMFFEQALVPGMSLTTTATPYSIRVGSSGTRCTMKVESVDDERAPVVTQYITMFIRGMSDGDGGGPDKPDHTFPEAVRGAEVGQYAVHVDDDQTFRYRAASHDEMPIHWDDALAKSVGLPGIIAHGLCTMAMTSQAVINTVAGGDPARLRRLAVRFSKNVFPGSDVVTTIYDTGSDGGRRVYAYEAHSRGDLVIANGRAEIET